MILSALDSQEPRMVLVILSVLAMFLQLLLVGRFLVLALHGFHFDFVLSLALLRLVLVILWDFGRDVGAFQLVLLRLFPENSRTSGAAACALPLVLLALFPEILDILDGDVDVHSLTLLHEFHAIPHILYDGAGFLSVVLLRLFLAILDILAGDALSFSLVLLQPSLLIRRILDDVVDVLWRSVLLLLVLLDCDAGVVVHLPTLLQPHPVILDILDDDGLSFSLVLLEHSLETLDVRDGDVDVHSLTLLRPLLDDVFDAISSVLLQLFLAIPRILADAVVALPLAVGDRGAVVLLQVLLQLFLAILRILSDVFAVIPLPVARDACAVALEVVLLHNLFSDVVHSLLQLLLIDDATSHLFLLHILSS